MPKRIQMSRQKPWRADNPDAVRVDRTTKWGNPFRVGAPYGLKGQPPIAAATPELVVELYRLHISIRRDEIRAELAGKDLACWCALDAPCHADVLLEIANPPLCPECRDGKPWNCIGWTLTAEDQVVDCATAEGSET